MDRERLVSSRALEREAQLSQALVLLVGRHAAPPQAPRSPGGERRAVRLSREYLEEHAAENVSLAALGRWRAAAATAAATCSATMIPARS